jgi:tRNA-2-methylthio-N6-dimethylallyladenosine synthase
MTGTFKFHIDTWGCQMNVLDSERMAGLLQARGHVRAGEVQDADVLLFNTCNVREKAESKLYSELGLYSGWKRERSGRVIGVTGCVAQQEGGRILENLPYVDFVLGTGNVEKLPEAIERAAERPQYLEFVTDSPVYQFHQISRGSHFQAFVTAIEGCDQFCTFCVVPFTRGRERSRRSSEIVAEVSELAQKGYTEITLLGQTVNAYRCPETGISLAELLAGLSRIEEIARLRFLTSHPAFVTPEFARALGQYPRIARYFHLPAQSGSDRILRRMKRRYTAGEYLETLELVRREAPDVVFSSDFIVGFPGETEEDFEQTLRLIREAQFGSVFAFVYSPRPGTAASRWGRETEVPLEVARERLERVLELQREIQRRQNEDLKGRTYEVLVEGDSKHGLSLKGRTSCNRIVHFDPPGRDRVRAGEYVHVRIEKGFENSLRGALA